MQNTRLKEELERQLTRHAGENVSIHAGFGLGGGCINNAQRLETSAGDFFVKWNAAPLPRLFEAEAAGLRALHKAGAIQVPQPIAHGNGANGVPPYLLTTYIQQGTRASDFSEDFGRRFARLHRQGTAEKFGFDHDNYLGSTPQENGWADNWVEFWRERRLGYQLRLAEKNGYGGELQKLGGKLMGRLEEYISEPNEPPALLHGDLWGGNYITGPDGYAAIIDPAAYYGRREADLAMTRLFGGFDTRFYKAYEEEWPLADGKEARLDLYMLYHVLNHLNLFGGGYQGQCISIMRRYVE